VYEVQEGTFMLGYGDVNYSRDISKFQLKLKISAQTSECKEPCIVTDLVTGSLEGDLLLLVWSGRERR